MKTKKLVNLIALLIFLGLVSTSSASGSSALTMSVKTDKNTYDRSELVTITGRVESNGSPVANATWAVCVCDPQGNIIESWGGYTAQNGSYTDEFRLDPLAAYGNYTVYASAATPQASTSNQTTFAVRDPSAVPEQWNAPWLIVCFMFLASIVIAKHRKRIKLNEA